MENGVSRPLLILLKRPMMSEPRTRVAAELVCGKKFKYREGAVWAPRHEYEKVVKKIIIGGACQVSSFAPDGATSKLASWC
jgi:hypothetical protein